MASPKVAAASAISAGALLEVIRVRPRTRGELLELTGLSRSALALRLDALTASHLIRADQRSASTGGRPAELLSFNTDAGVFVVADLEATARLAITDLGGEVRVESEEEIDLFKGPEATIDWLAGRLETVLVEAGIARRSVWALVVGVPAPVSVATGELASRTMIPGWDGYPLAEALRARVHVPVLVENDVNVIAIGEQASSWQNVDDLIFVKLGAGVGAAILSGGVIQRGVQGLAGDIGHIRVAGYGEIPCHCGGTGCLGTVAAGTNIVHRLTEAGISVDTVDDVIELVRAGSPEALPLIRDAGRATGAVLAALVNALNPAVLVIGGDLVAAGAPLLAGIREQVYALATASATHDLRIATSRAGQRAGLRGATALAITQLLGDTDRLLASQGRVAAA